MQEISAYARSDHMAKICRKRLVRLNSPILFSLLKHATHDISTQYMVFFLDIDTTDCIWSHDQVHASPALPAGAALLTLLPRPAMYFPGPVHTSEQRHE